MNISTVTTLPELQALSSDWLELVDRARCSLPYQLPEWLISWWNAFHEDQRLIRDSLRVKVLRRNSGELVGIFPFMLTERPRFGPLRARGLNLLGADPYLTEQRAPLVDPLYEADVGRALVKDLLAEPAWDWIAWDGLQRDSALATAIESAAELRWGRTETANILTLAPTWEQFKSGLKRNIKESLRHCHNALQRDGLTVRFVVAETAADVDAALDTFFRLHTLRAGQAETIQHRDRFSAPRSRAFLRAVCARLAERDAARVFTLHVGDTPVAARVGFLLPDCLYLYYSGFDPGWGRYGVMTTTLAEAIKYAIASGIPRVHLSMGVDDSKSRWGPERVDYQEALEARPAWSSRSALRLYLWAREDVALRRALGRVLPRRQLT